MANEGAHIETERKFIIKMPDTAALMRLPGCVWSRITQTYLLSEEKLTDRVRKRVYGDKTVYTHTTKRRISPMSSVEDEKEITQEEYRLLKQRRDPEKNKIRKQRFAIPYGGRIVEIDVFEFWKRQAMMEIELTEEADAVELPPFVTVIREVTGDRSYSNNAMSKNIPAED